MFDITFSLVQNLLKGDKFMKKLLKNKKGFTLIELIVVIAILAILAAILIPSIIDYIDTATRAKDQANARSYYTEYMLDVATEADEATGYAIPGGCTYTLDVFSCTIDGYTYSSDDDFEPTAASIS